MANTQSNLITLEDGRIFPEYQGKPLSWDMGSEFSLSDEQAGYPKTRAIIRAFRDHRPEQFRKEKYLELRATFDRVFGGNAKRLLAIMEQES